MEETPASDGSEPVDARDVELGVWNDPTFRRHFIDSYIAETEIEPRVTQVERGQLEKVLDLIASEETDRAMALLEKHRGEAASAAFDFTLGNIHFQRDELELAATAYEIAVERHPKFRRAWQNLGLIHVRQGDHEKAALALARVLVLGGGDGVTYGLLGFSYSSLENHISAETAYRMAILLDPDTMDWKLGLARSFFKQQRYADAVALCRNLIEASPDRADLWLLQANAYIGVGQPLLAAENYEMVDRLGQATVESLTNLADIYVNADLFELAVQSYARALEKDEAGNVERALRACQVLTARGANEETRILVARIEELHADRLSAEDQKNVLRLRARLAVAEGAGDEEARILEELVELDPLDGEALILLGQHAGRQDDLEKAIFFYERAASIEKFEADAKVRHAQLLVGQRRYSEALPLLRSAQNLKPRENVREYLEQVERVAQAR
jgi:tetratricopeptide (TPR) repeat protein